MFAFGRPSRLVIPDVLGLLWVLAAAGAVMAPAFVHGAFLGSFDWVSQYGLSQAPGVIVHNHRAFDQVSEFIPWTNLAWTQVHHGHLPLWNPYSVNGLPLAFNWQAGTFSVPVLLGYLVPLRDAYTVQVLVTLVLAGTGVYVLGRVLRLGVLGCAMAATIYELSGPSLGWLGWPIASVMSWLGWLFAASLLVVRARHRPRAIVLLAVVVACAVYAGQPDTLVLLGSALLVFLAALFISRVSPFADKGPILRPVMDTLVATVAGAALSAPLLLPGLQILPGSLRTGKSLSRAVPTQSLVLVLFQGFDGSPVAGSQWFGPATPWTVAYVGVVAVVLAVLAVMAAVKLRHRRPEVIAFGALALAMTGIVYVPVIESLLDGLPLVGGDKWFRATMPMAFAVAVLAGMGTDVLVRWHRERVIRRWMGWAFGASAVLLLGLWLFGRGHLPPLEASIRAKSFIWPAATTLLGLGVTGGLVLVHRRRQCTGTPVGGRFGAGGWAAAVLLAGETAFLVAAGAPLWSSSSTYLAPTPAESTLARVVGSSLVGFGLNTCFSPSQLGIVPNVNVAFAVREFAVYDPLIPRRYGETWRGATGQTATLAPYAGAPYSVFCPAVETATIARRYGIAYVLERKGAPGPSGSVFDQAVGNEYLYRIPGSGPATLTPIPSTGKLPAPNALGTVVPVTDPDPSSWRLVTDAGGPQVLRLRLSATPGWHATIDGRPLALERFAGVMLQARIPPGRHVVVLRYWPSAFTAGIVLAVGCAATFAAVFLAGWVRRRRRPRPRGVETATPAMGPT